MNPKVVRATHVAMHHKLHRQLGRLTGLEHHRTDGGFRRSAPLHNSDIRAGREPQGSISDIAQLEDRFHKLAQFHVP